MDCGDIMKKRILLISISIIFIITLFLLIYPRLEFFKNDYFYITSYSKGWIDSEDLEKLEQEMCYDESYSYYKNKDISIIKWEYNNFLFFRWFKIEYEEGNVCEAEYLLEESYIENFIKNAEIITNEDNVNLAKLIEGKTPIVGNTRYPWNDNYLYIEYKLDGKYMDMYISTNEDGLLVIQVGLSDEGPKFIAYK